MKKMLALLLAAVLMFSLAACGGKPAANPSSDGSSASSSVPESSSPSSSAPEVSPSSTPESSSTTSSSESTPPPPPEPEPEPEPEPVYAVNHAGSFQNGYAYIYFRDTTGNKSYSGIIDTKGKLQSYFEGNTVDSDRNTSGYIYTQNRDNNAVFVVGPDGKAVTHSLGDDLRLFAALGDGYLIIEEHQAGFDAEDWVYHLYDGSGKELTSFSYGCTVNLGYWGDGIFAIFPNTSKEFTEEQITARNNYGRGVQYADLYFAQADVWQRDQLTMTSTSAFQDFLCQDGIIMLRGASNQENRNPNPGEYTYADSKGVLNSITVPKEIGKDPFYLGHRDGVMLFTERSNSQIIPVYRYDVASGQWSSYQGKYADKMHNSSSYVSVTGEGYTAIALKGADSRVYTMLLDKELKEVWDSPILGIPSAITGGTLYLFDPDNTSTVCSYDLKGNPLGKVEGVDRYNFWPEDGVITSSRAYFSPDGSPAFEIDYTTGKLVTLPE